MRVAGKDVLVTLLRVPFGNKGFLNNALIFKLPPLTVKGVSLHFPLCPYDSVMPLRQPREMFGQGQHCVPDGTPGFVHVSVFYQHRIPDGMSACRAGHIVSTERYIPNGMRRTQSVRIASFGRISIRQIQHAQSVRIASFGRISVRQMPSASRQRCIPNGMTNPVSGSVTPLFRYSVIN